MVIKSIVSLRIESSSLLLRRLWNQPDNLTPIAQNQRSMNMFARHVVVRLKPKSAPEFTRLVEKEVIPMLRKQKGFLDEITFISPDLTQAVGNSFWATQADAEAYSRKGYSEVLKVLARVLDGTPTVGTAIVSNSTFHKIAAAHAA